MISNSPGALEASLGLRARSLRMGVDEAKFFRDFVGIEMRTERDKGDIELGKRIYHTIDEAIGGKNRGQVNMFLDSSDVLFLNDALTRGISDRDPKIRDFCVQKRAKLREALERDTRSLGEKVKERASLIGEKMRKKAIEGIVILISELT